MRENLSFLLQPVFAATLAKIFNHEFGLLGHLCNLISFFSFTFLDFYHSTKKKRTKVKITSLTEELDFRYFSIASSFFCRQKF